MNSNVSTGYFEYNVEVFNYSSGIFKLTTGVGKRLINFDGAGSYSNLILDTFYQSSYHSNHNESRPKTKFFSLLIYAGYPMQ